MAVAMVVVVVVAVAVVELGVGLRKLEGGLVGVGRGVGWTLGRREGHSGWLSVQSQRHLRGKI